jgi:hypothetical protein
MKGHKNTSIVKQESNSKAVIYEFEGGEVGRQRSKASFSA